MTGNIAEVVESMYKLLRISASLEIFDASRINNLNPSLNHEFFASLGEIKTLKVLDISFSGQLSNVAELAKSVAFNARKSGALE